MKKIIAGVLLSSFALMACNTTPPIIPDTSVRFVNTVESSEGMKVFSGSDKISGAGFVAFKSAFPSSSTFQTLKAGPLTLSMCLDDSLDCLSGVKNKLITLNGNQQTSVFLIGTKSTSDDTGTDGRPLEALTFESDVAIPTTGKMKIRVIHAANLVAAKTVDLYIAAPTTALDTLVPVPLKYKELYNYRELAAGAYRIRATTPNVTNTSLVDSGTLTLAPDKVYTALVVNPDAGGMGVVLLTDK